MSFAHYAALLIWGLSVLMVVSLFKTVKYGARLASQFVYDPSTLQIHQRWVWRTFWSTAMAVGVIEPTLRMLHVPLTPFFWWVHFPLLLAYALSFSSAWLLNGLAESSSSRYAHRHNQLGRNAQLFGTLTALTGDWLVFTLIWLHYPTVLH